MPVYRERVYLCPAENGQPAWVMDFPLWWDRRAFFTRYGERQIDTGHPAYVDYGLLLTPAEAFAWDRKCRDAFNADPRSQLPKIVEAMQQWDASLKLAAWIIVESYEWESGLE